MKPYPILMAVLLVFVLAVGPATSYAGAFDGAAEKADHGAEVAGEKIDASTKALRRRPIQLVKRLSTRPNQGLTRWVAFSTKPLKPLRAG